MDPRHSGAHNVTPIRSADGQSQIDLIHQTTACDTGSPMTLGGMDCKQRHQSQEPRDPLPQGSLQQPPRQCRQQQPQTWLDQLRMRVQSKLALPVWRSKWHA